MIHIIFDTQKLMSPTSQNIIRNIGEYPVAYVAILLAHQSKSDLHYTVYISSVLQWLKNLSLRYPQGTFIFETLDARQALAQKWGVVLPAELRNEEIIESNLLALDLQPQPGQTFEDLLLAHFFAPLFSAKSFPFTQLAQLFATIDTARWQENRANPLLARTLNQRLEIWKSKARSDEQRQFIEWFAVDPLDLQKRLMQFRVLRSYPAIGETLLGSVYPVLTALKLQLQDLAADEKSIPDTVTQVTYQLNAYMLQSAEELGALIMQVSGLLWVEFETLEKHLLTKPDWISPTVVDQLESKFEVFSRRIAKRLVILRSQIRPPKPSSPEANWDAAQMLVWATESYLPYQAWCSAREQFDKDLYALGDQFSSWLMNHWNDLHGNSGRMVFNILPNLAPGLNNPERVHLVLVVDNLGWSFSEILRDLFQEKGFYLTSTEPYFAMLPTETEISKKCLLSGSVGYTAIDETSYKGILEKGWVPYFNNNAFRYISDIGKLGQVEAIDARVYVVNYLAVDKTLHKSADEIGMPHREHVRHLLEKLVENVASFIEMHALGDRIRIHIVSDHGSTQIPAAFQNDIDPSFFKQEGFTARSHRYLEVSDGRFAALSDNLKLDCFFLSANDFLLPTNVLCARRANRFLPVDKDVFIHGGMLPEEVIVPYMAFEPASVPLQNLTILLQKNEFRYRLETISLEIGNPNAAAVEQVQVSALNGNVEWEFESIPLLNGKTKVTRQVTVRFKLTSLVDEQTTLGLRVRFRTRGETHVIDVKLPIIMRKIVEERSTGIFDD